MTQQPSERQAAQRGIADAKALVALFSRPAAADAAEHQGLRIDDSGGIG